MSQIYSPQGIKYRTSIVQKELEEKKEAKREESRHQKDLD